MQAKAWFVTLIVVIAIASGTGSYIASHMRSQEPAGSTRTTSKEEEPTTLADVLPRAVGGRVRTSILTGEQAMRATRGLHSGTVQPAADAAIVTYGADLTIWLTRYGDRATAQKELDRMASAMERFGGGFEKLSADEVDGAEVYVTRPKEKPQYFWRRDDTDAYIVPGLLGVADTELLIHEIDRKLDSLPAAAILNPALDAI